MNARTRAGLGVALSAALVLVGALALRSRGANDRGNVIEAGVATATRSGDGDKLGLRPSALAKNPIAVAKAERTKLAADLQVVGSVSYDQDHYAVVGPLVAGRVVRLRVGVGDVVGKGQPLADIESAEVGQAQAALLSAAARANAAQANLRRERDLSAQKISSERDREIAEAQAIVEAAEMKAAVERLKAMGLTDGEVEAIKRGESTGGRIALRAPIHGVVITRSITLGQAVERATDAYKLITLSHLWVMLDIYEKDLDRVHVGQQVRLRAEARGEVIEAHVGYVSPIIDEKTRTASVRIEFDNPDGKLHPGEFVTAKILGDPKFARSEVLAVPRRAVATVEGRPLVFVKLGDRFERRVVELGRSSGELIEIRQGLAAGEEVATDGAFLLKSELLR